MSAENVTAALSQLQQAANQAVVECRATATNFGDGATVHAQLSHEQ